MNPAEEKELQRYVRSVADELGLQHWHLEVEVTDEHPPADTLISDAEEDDWPAAATCDPIPGMHRATLRFSTGFREESPEDQRETVVHELIHCHLADLYEFGRKGMSDLVHQSVYDMFMYGFSLAWEHAVDGMARAWSPKLPLMEWPKVKAKEGD